MNDKKMRDVPGVGHVTEQTLNGLGVHACSDIENHLVEIYMNYSETFFEFITKASMGIGRNTHNILEEDIKKKSVSFTLSFRAITRFE